MALVQRCAARTCIGTIGALMLFALLTGNAYAEGCPANAVPYKTDRQDDTVTVHCRCKTGFVKVGDGCEQAKKPSRCKTGFVKVNGRCERAKESSLPPVVPNLAKDPDAAQLSTAELRVVDARIAHLHKAIKLLNDSNPAWGKERQRLAEDLHENVVALSWEGVNLLTLGLAEWNKIAAAKHVSNVKVDTLTKLFKEPMAHLPAEEVRLKKVLTSSADPTLTSAILKYIASLHRLEEARYYDDVAVVGARVRDVVEALHHEFEIMKIIPPKDATIYDALYVSSAFVGRFAMIFAEGPAGVAVVAGSALSSLAVGGRLLVNIWDEHKQFTELSQRASDRHRMQQVLQGRLNELEQERERLLWAVDRSR